MPPDERELLNSKKRKKAECDILAAQPKSAGMMGGTETKNQILEEPEIALSSDLAAIDDENEEKIDRIGTNPFVDNAGGHHEEEDEKKDDSVVSNSLFGPWQPEVVSLLTTNLAGSRSGNNIYILSRRFCRVSYAYV